MEMILKNLLRRKGRTFLTVLGIAVGVAAIITLGTLADGIEGGYSTVITGSKADLAVSDPNAFDLTMSSVEERIGDELRAMPEVEDVTSVLHGIVRAEDLPYFFVYAYAPDSFILERFSINEGVSLDSPEAREAHGKPLLLGSAAAESLHRDVGDSLRLSETTFRIVGIYTTGDPFEEGGAVILLDDAQEMLGLPGKVSVFYLKLTDASLADRLILRFDRLHPELSMTSTETLRDNAMMGDAMRGFAWGISALAVVIGGVGMMNAQLMAVFERTREIGVLRALGWGKPRVLWMILGETLLVALTGGAAGLLVAYGLLILFEPYLSMFGATISVRPALIAQAFGTVIVLATVGGLYPAWEAAQLPPVEALRYEGGNPGKGGRLPFGGMPLQNLWRRRTRSLLAISALTLTIGSIMWMDALGKGFLNTFTEIAGDAEIVVRQRDAADTGYAVVDERIGQWAAGLPEVESTSGMMFTGTTLGGGSIFFLMGYNPHSMAMQDVNVVEGEYLTGNREMILGRAMAESLDIGVDDTVEIDGIRYRVRGIFESGNAWEEAGGIISLRDAQAMTGRPRKVTFVMVDVRDPRDVQHVIDQINAQYPAVIANRSAEFAEQTNDMQATMAMVNGIAIMALLVGGIGMMNTMLMTVLERTREIGALRALGWRRRTVLSLILRESLILCVISLAFGSVFAALLSWLFPMLPMYGSFMITRWDAVVVARAFAIAILLGVFGGLYPALRATWLQPVEALRYE
ncbi:MAG: ABC transporter permease [Anaerolineae bacterium]|nr:ABC transporter permease [Anaerolineae bacterium]